MDDSETRRTQLLQHLSEMMDAVDAQTMVTAALQPTDIMTRKMAELIWLGLPSETKTALGDSLETFLEVAVRKEPVSKFISPAAQKHIRQRKERQWN